jgi:CheY-like chemotaxis protein
MKILIVDDEEDIRLSLKDVLEAQGYQITLAENGKECLTKLRKEKFDLVLMDILMPGMSGTDTFNKIIKDEKLKNTKVILISVINYGIQGREKLSDLGVIDFINKPFNLKSLLSKVKKALS